MEDLGNIRRGEFDDNVLPISILIHSVTVLDGPFRFPGDSFASSSLLLLHHNDGSGRIEGESIEGGNVGSEPGHFVHLREDGLSDGGGVGEEGDEGSFGVAGGDVVAVCG